MDFGLWPLAYCRSAPVDHSKTKGQSPKACSCLFAALLKKLRDQTSPARLMARAYA